MVAREYNLSTGVVEADSWSPLAGQSIILGEFQASKESYLNKVKQAPPHINQNQKSLRNDT